MSRHVEFNFKRALEPNALQELMDVWWQNIEKNIGCSEMKFGQ
jgi:hypothetical protein